MGKFTGMNDMKNNEHVVILGAGPAGLATGHELSVSGVKVSVIERNDFVGGLCNTNDYKGYKFDLGGHPTPASNRGRIRLFVVAGPAGATTGSVPARWERA